MIDQRKLPASLEFLECADVECVARAIETMAVRGAPAIGAAAAYGLALAASAAGGGSREEVLEELSRAADRLRSTRPTAVNLFWAVDRVLRAARRVEDAGAIASAVLREANAIAEEDVRANLAIGEHGKSLIGDGSVVMTICNAGSLATVWYGTATAPMYSAHREGRKFRVVALETRPVLQGARLTAFELSRAGIPVTLIVDGAAGHVMRELGVDLVITGADRILSDGTVYNKIGTFNLAVLAHELGIPFFVAAPTSSFDLEAEPGEVEIEVRPPEEVTTLGGSKIAPRGVDVYNPAFDFTPPKYLSGIITERGILRPPLSLSIRRAFGG